jgi:hypothetical protein
MVACWARGFLYPGRLHAGSVLRMRSTLRAAWLARTCSRGPRGTLAALPLLLPFHLAFLADLRVY